MTDQYPKWFVKDYVSILVFPWSIVSAVMKNNRWYFLLVKMVYPWFSYVSHTFIHLSIQYSSLCMFWCTNVILIRKHKIVAYTLKIKFSIWICVERQVSAGTELWRGWVASVCLILRTILSFQLFFVCIHRWYMEVEILAMYINKATGISWMGQNMQAFGFIWNIEMINKNLCGVWLFEETGENQWIHFGKWELGSQESYLNPRVPSKTEFL